MTGIRRANTLRTLGPGLAWSLRTGADVEALHQRLTSATESGLFDTMMSYFPPQQRLNWLAGRVGRSQVRVHMPDRDRKPWWILAPVFRGEIVTDGHDDAILAGVFRIRRTTLLAAALALPVAVVCISGSAGWLFGLSTWAGFLGHAVFGLPHTCSSLMTRLESVCLERTPPE
jgi:hypothetical protein